MRWPRISLSRSPETIADYAGVLVPLQEAHLHSYSARCGRTEYEEVSSDDDAEAGEGLMNGLGRASAVKERGDDSGGDANDEMEGSGMLPMRAAEYSIDGLRQYARRGGDGEGKRSWTEYELKSKIVNKAIQDIGMGRYNWQLFVLCGFGWFADNLWMQGISLTLPSLSAEFDISEKSVRYTTSSLFLGLCIGSFLWGIGSDILGRRIAFNCTLLITAIFGILIPYATSWPWVCVLWACLGFGVGGNLPVDGALFLEFLPDASSSLLTLLSVWWPIGQLVASLVAWYCIPRYPAGEGWRWFVWVLGVVTMGMFAVRYFLFHMFESPKYLLSRGRQAEAVAVVHGLAYRNGVNTWLTAEILDAVVDGSNVEYDDGTSQAMRNGAVLSSASKVMMQKMERFSGSRLKPLFKEKKLGLATALMWWIWLAIGLGYPLFNAFLPQYLSHNGDSSTEGAISSRQPMDHKTPATELNNTAYRNFAILSIAGVPGSLLAYFSVDSPSPFLGRRGTLAISTFISALFLFLFVTFGRSSSSQLFFSCVEAFSQNIMYGVLYAFTPEMFPAPVRGAGTGVASFLNRAAGLAAPVLAALLPGDGATLPIYLSGALILAAFGGMVLIPVETRGQQRL